MKNMRTYPTLSCLISVRNGEQWIDECLSSILQQKYEDFEIVVVDDGSIDHSLDILNKWSSAHDNIKIHSKSPTNLADSLNYGAQFCLGKYLARMDIDDRIIGERFAKQVEFLDAHSEHVLVGSNFQIIDEIGEIVGTYNYKKHTNYGSNLKRGISFFPHSSITVKRETFDIVGGYSQKMKLSQDWDLWLRLVDYGEFHFCEDYFLQLRKHRRQSSNHNSGYDQMVFSFMAQVSFLARSKINRDPVREFDTIDFQKFFDFVRRSLERVGHFDFVLLKTEIKRDIGNFPRTDIWRLAGNILKYFHRRKRFLDLNQEIYELWRQECAE